MSNPLENLQKLLDKGFNSYQAGGCGVATDQAGGVKKYTLRPIIQEEDISDTKGELTMAELKAMQSDRMRKIKRIIEQGTSPCPWVDYLACIPMDEKKIKELMNDSKKLLEKSQSVKNKHQKGGADITLQKIIKNYQKEEFITGTNELICTNKSKGKFPFYRKIELKNPDNKYSSPDDLIFSLKRFNYDIKTGLTSKTDTSVNIPDSLTMYDKKYNLTVVIIHQGSFRGGHYYTLVKNKDKKWIILNDEDPVKEYSDAKNTINNQGYMFLYKSVKNEIQTNQRNGIRNIGNSCYFNALLQLLISTDEYINTNKMKKYRPELHTFLTECTKVTTTENGNRFNDGTYLKTFNDKNVNPDKISSDNDYTFIDKDKKQVKEDIIKNLKKQYVLIRDKENNETYNKLFEFKNNKLEDIGYAGVSVFGNALNRLGWSCQEDAKIALDLLIDSDIFPYKNNTPIYSVKQADINKEPLITTYKNKGTYFTTNPPFYKYITVTSIEIKDKECPEKRNRYEIEQLSFSINKPAKTPVTPVTKPVTTPATAVTPVTTPVSAVTPVTTPVKTPDPVKQPEKLVSASEKQYDSKEVSKELKAVEDEINRSIEKSVNHLDLLTEAFNKKAPVNKNVFIGEDMATELLRQENHLRTMVNGIRWNGEIVKENIVDVMNNLDLDDTKSGKDIKGEVEKKILKKEETINKKVKEISLLFRALFHARQKMSSVNLMWGV